MEYLITLLLHLISYSNFGQHSTATKFNVWCRYFYCSCYWLALTLCPCFNLFCFLKCILVACCILFYFWIVSMTLLLSYSKLWWKIQIRVMGLFFSCFSIIKFPGCSITIIYVVLNLIALNWHLMNWSYVVSICNPNF